MDLAQKVGEQITIDSVAENASQGAVVTVGRTPVYIDGLERWDKATRGQQVSVTGTLRLEPGDDELVNDKVEHSTGVPSGRYILDGATWKTS